MLFVFEHAQLAATTTDASTPFTALIGCCFYICLSKPLSTPETVYFRYQSYSFLFIYGRKYDFALQLHLFNCSRGNFKLVVKLSV